MPADKSENEFERLLELAEFELDYTSLEDNLKDLTDLAARIAGTEVSVINLIDNYTQWSVADHGLDADQMPREESVCQYTILEDDHLEIKDLSKDSRFKDREYVTNGEELRYYYGMPLETSEGMNIGTLCVLDSQEKEISPESKELLKMVARQVVRRLEALKKIKELEDKVSDLDESRQKASHDIRNPVSGIIGIANMIEEEARSEEVDEIIDLAHLIKQGGNGLLEMVEAILDDYDNKKEEKEAGNSAVNCAEFCTKLRELYQPQAKSKNISLDISSNSEFGEVFLSKNRLLQIVGNLLSNSIKFTESGGSVNVRLHVEKTDDNKNRRLAIEVEDTGVGMSQDKIETIMSDSVKSEGGTGGEEGYGMGLSLVRHLVEKADGDMQVESEKGKGTAFFITLPL